MNQIKAHTSHLYRVGFIIVGTLLIIDSGIPILYFIQTTIYFLKHAELPPPFDKVANGNMQIIYRVMDLLVLIVGISMVILHGLFSRICITQFHQGEDNELGSMLTPVQAMIVIIGMLTLPGSIINAVRGSSGISDFFVITPVDFGPLLAGGNNAC